MQDVLKVARRLSEVVAELSEGEGKQSAGEAEVALSPVLWPGTTAAALTMATQEIVRDLIDTACGTKEI